MITGEVGVSGPPTTTFGIGFDVFMDTAVVPLAGSFTCISDGMPKVLSNLTWLNPLTLLFDFPGPGPAVFANITLDVLDGNLRSSIFEIATPPQEQQFFPTSP